jgi:hypothetical protein
MTNAAELLDKLRAVVGEYVVMPSDASADAVALWIAATHAIDCWDHATRLVIKSPEKRCGKSRLLDIIEATVFNPLITANASPAAIFRSIDGKRPPTLIFDEMDAIFGTKIQAERNEDFRALINAGFGRSRPSLRADGPNHNVKEFPTFAMAALAGIGPLPDTIEDRAVIVNLRRRAAGETVRPYREKHKPRLQAIGAEVAKWIDSIRDELRAAEPEMHPLEDRAADLWEPLVAVADAAGGRWPQAARIAAQILAAESSEADADAALGTRLLSDIKDLFASEDVSFMASAFLVYRLRHLDDAPWCDLDLSTRRLASRLKGYGIKPGHNTDGKQRGYQLATFADAFLRYVPSENVRSSDAPEIKGFTLTDENLLTDRSVRRFQSVRVKPNEHKGSDDLTASDGNTRAPPATPAIDDQEPAGRVPEIGASTTGLRCACGNSLLLAGGRSVCEACRVATIREGGVDGKRTQLSAKRTR